MYVKSLLMISFTTCESTLFSADSWSLNFSTVCFAPFYTIIHIMLISIALFRSSISCVKSFYNRIILVNHSCVCLPLWPVEFATEAFSRAKGICCSIMYIECSCRITAGVWTLLFRLSQSSVMASVSCLLIVSLFVLCSLLIEHTM